MSTQISTEATSKQSETFEYKNRVLGYAAEILKEMDHLSGDLEKLLQGLERLALRLAFLGLIVWAIFHVFTLVLHS